MKLSTDNDELLKIAKLTKRNNELRETVAAMKARISEELRRNVAEAKVLSETLDDLQELERELNEHDMRLKSLDPERQF